MRKPVFLSVEKLFIPNLKCPVFRMVSPADLSYCRAFFIVFFICHPMQWYHCLLFLLWKLQVTIFIESTLHDYLFTKWEHSLIFSALKKSCFLKSMLLPNFAFDVIYTGKKIIIIIFQRCLNRYYLMILSWCYYKSLIRFS